MHGCCTYERPGLWPHYKKQKELQLEEITTNFNARHSRQIAINNFKTMRRQSKLRQHDVAERLGICQPDVSCFERDKWRKVSIRVLCTLLGYCGSCLVMTVVDGECIQAAVDNWFDESESEL